MAFNGSGTYSPPSPQYPAVAGTLIKAADFNAIIVDIASALSMCLLKDGQQVPTAAQPMGGFRHTNVAKAQARNEYATLEQVQDGEANFITAANVAGTANAVTLAISPAPSGYEASIDLFYLVEIENTSEDVTHTLNALAALNTKKFYGGTKVKVAIGDLQVGMMAHLKYDGTDLILMNPRGYAQGADVASAATIDLDAVTGDLVDVTGTTNITAITLRRGQERTIRFTGVLTFTHGASLVLPGAANITTAAGDYAIVRGYAAGVVRCVSYVRASVPPLSSYVLDVVTATTEVLNTAAETTAYTKTIPANTLGTNRALRLTLIGDYLNDSGATRSPTIKVKFGATTIFHGVFTDMAANGNRRNFRLVYDLQAKGATNAQVGGGTAALGTTQGAATSAIAGESRWVSANGGHNAIAEDSTGALALVVTVQHATADATQSFKTLSARLELL